jgi:amino acid transporter
MPAELARGERLVRAIGFPDLVALAVNGIVGAGIFGLSSEVYRRSGAYSLTAFAVCAAISALFILCFAEVSSRFSATGGPYLYARAAFGSLAGVEVGWMMWVSRITSFAANCNLLIAYAAVFLPIVGAGAGRAASIAVVVAALTAVNVIGVRRASDFTNVLTVAKLGGLALFVVVGVFFVDVHRLAPGVRPPLHDFSSSVLLLVYAFTGFEMAVIPGGELRDPGRDLPRALLTTIALVAALYLGIQLVAIGTLPELATSARPLADAARRIAGPAGAAVIAASAIVSILGNLNVTMLAAPRLLFAMAERGELPAVLGSTSARFRTPAAAIVFSGALALVLTLTGTFVYGATLSVIARLVGYGATCLALPVLRRSRGAAAARFVAPAGTAAAVASALIVCWLLGNASAREARDAAIAAAAGLAIYAASRSRRRTSEGL